MEETLRETWLVLFRQKKKKSIVKLTLFSRSQNQDPIDAKYLLRWMIYLSTRNGKTLRFLL